MGLDLGYKMDVAAIPMEILSKFPLIRFYVAFTNDGSS